MTMRLSEVIAQLSMAKDIRGDVLVYINNRGRKDDVRINVGSSAYVLLEVAPVHLPHPDPGV